MRKHYNFIKLDEDDILEILIEHFQEGSLAGYPQAQSCLLGTPGNDLRFIGVFSDDEDEFLSYNLEKIDKEIDYNGDHSFINSRSEFQIHPKRKGESMEKDV